MEKVGKYQSLLRMYARNPGVWCPFYQGLKYYDDATRATKEDIEKIDDRSYHNELRFV